MHYLTVEDVARFNAAEVADSKVRDFGLLESAVFRPQTTVGGRDAYPDIHTKAAALFESIIRNHAFADGNHRTGVLAAAVFYGLNGYVLDAPQATMVDLAIATGDGTVDLDEIAATFENWAVPQT